jgi:hypothetical protein
MTPMTNGYNVLDAHLIFMGTDKPGTQWADKNEQEAWDPRVVVSFQDKAWDDAKKYWN